MDKIGPMVARDLVRLRRNIKQSELAAKLGCDPSRISRIERGEVVLSETELADYLEAIGTDEAIEYGSHMRSRWSKIEKPDFWHPDRPTLEAADSTMVAVNQFVAENQVEGPVRAQFDMHMDSLERLVEFLERLDHRIAFIGDIGVGKSTAICMVSDLLISSGKDAVKNIGETVVLETNAGGATICEVRIKHRPETNYGILIQPHTMDEIFNLIGDLSQSVKFFGGSNSTEQQSHEERSVTESNIAQETNRALRNMAGLSRTRVRSSEGKLRTHDPIEKLAKQSGSPEKLRAEIFERLRLPDRTRTEIWYDPITNMRGLEWLKDAFNKINNGRMSDVSLPRGIDIIVPEPVFDHPQYSIEIIDSKGVDGTAIRPDIEQYVDDDRTLVVLCSRYNSAPDLSIQGLIEHLNDRGGEANLFNGGVLLTLPHAQETSGTKDDGGEIAETPEEAYAIKQDQIELKLSDANADSLPIAFFNATVDDPGLVRGELLRALDGMRKSRVTRVEEVIGVLQRSMDNFEEEQARAADEEIRRQLSLFLENSSQMSSRIRQPHDTMIEAIRIGHPSTVAASTRRNGSWLNLDVFYLIGVGTAIDARIRTQEATSHLNAVLEQMSNDPNLELSRDLLNEISQSSDHWRREFLAEVTRAGSEIYRPVLYPAYALWGMCSSRYGQGSGYRDDVADWVRDWCEHPDRRPQLTDVESRVDDAWERQFLQPLRNLVATHSDTKVVLGATTSDAEDREGSAPVLR